MSLPKVTVIGTLTADPELRFTPSGAAVANFTIAANDRKYNKNTQEWEDGDTTFLRATVWKDYAEHVAESLTRGTQVIATGSLKQRSYETREGEKRTVMELEIDDVGPTMRYATAKVTKATRGGNRAPAAASTTTSNDDGWGAVADDAPPW